MITGGVPLARPSSGGAFKVKLCSNWQAAGYCQFGQTCTFAHGAEELSQGHQGEPSTPEEALMYNTLKDFCAKVRHLETEWDPEKLAKKVYEYLKKADKGSASKPRPWQNIAEEYTCKFFESLFNALHDRTWPYDVDWSPVVGSAIAYFKELRTMDVSMEELLQVCKTKCTIQIDSMRYHTKAWDIVTACVPSKASQKKVRDAMDSSREEAVKQHPESVDAFITNWIQTAIKSLAKESPQGNPRATLDAKDAEKLFDAVLRNGSGVPLWLSTGHTLTSQAADAVALAYQAHAEPRPRAPKGGKYGGKGDAWGWSDGSSGFDWTGGFGDIFAGFAAGWGDSGKGGSFGGWGDSWGGWPMGGDACKGGGKGCNGKSKGWGPY